MLSNLRFVYGADSSLASLLGSDVADRQIRPHKCLDFFAPALVEDERATSLSPADSLWRVTSVYPKKFHRW